MKLYRKNLGRASRMDNHTLYGQKTTLLSIAITVALATVTVPPVLFADETPAITPATATEQHQSVILKYGKKDNKFSIYVEGVALDTVKSFTFNGVPIDDYIGTMVSQNLAEVTEQENGFVLSLVLSAETELEGGTFGILTTNGTLLSSDIPTYVVNWESEQLIESSVTQTQQEGTATVLDVPELDSSDEVNKRSVRIWPKDCSAKFSIDDLGQTFSTNWIGLGSVHWPDRKWKCLNDKALPYARSSLRTNSFSPPVNPQRVCDGTGGLRVYADTDVEGRVNSRDGSTVSWLGVSCLQVCDCPQGTWYDANRSSCVTNACQNVTGIPDGDKGGGYFAWQGTLFKNVSGATNCRKVVNGIQIKAVKYGEPGKSCDASTVFQKQCDALSSCSVKVDNSLCGDPVPGSVKKADITYLCKGKEQQVSVPENQTASLKCN